jgi:hypothetical protein
MIANVFKMKATVWQYPGAGGWHFLTLPQEESEIIKEAFSALKHGWGSLPVTVTIGQTSLENVHFPRFKIRQLPVTAQSGSAKKRKDRHWRYDNFLNRNKGLKHATKKLWRTPK